MGGAGVVGTYVAGAISCPAIRVDDGGGVGGGGGGGSSLDGVLKTSVYWPSGTGEGDGDGKAPGCVAAKMKNNAKNAI
jgi:hypothetical protein